MLTLIYACQEQPKIKTKKTENKVVQLAFGEVIQLASDFKFTEGPAKDSIGNVYFTDIPNQKIWIWTVEDELSLFKEDTGGANGLFFDTNQNLLACEGYRGQITSTTHNGKYTIIASTYGNVRFNQPNDIWPDSRGGAYFTDPEYNETPSLPQKGMHVYYILPQTNEVIRVCDDLVKPNGLIGSPDQKKLYVTDHGASITYRFTIEKYGKLSNKTIFTEVGGDGMTVDANGNVYLTTTGKKAVEVFSPDGNFLASISFPEQPSNVTFGGKDNNELFVTARTSIYKVKTNTQGVN